ncbi:hypothetical protein PDIDSM_3784 [Penicillium digitatum]|nr:hypothetical protein PDIDSM_3784 [Penicillium digitatum]
MSHNDFVDWWLETDYGRKSKLKWDSNRHTEIWNSYHQVAQGIDGAPKVMCKRCGKILEHPYTLSPNSTGKAQYHGTSTIQKHRKTAGCLRSEKGKKAEITNFLQREGEVSASIPFLQEDWEEDLLQFLTLNRLPFHLIEHPSFKRIINKARSAPSPPVIPSADTIRRRLGSLVKDRQQHIHSLDCWTSPFSQAFMAITGYFIDSDWVYREVLLGFKPLHGTHTGSYLSSVLIETLVEHNIEDKVFGLTTDNASNNKTLATALQQALSDDTIITRIPCLAHVIQLSLNQLLARIKAVPLNESAETRWTEKQSRLAQKNAKQSQISSTLNKVRYLAIYVNASPQRRETFYNLQTTNIKIVPIQDVKTRWNSTFLMLRRAKRLRAIFSLFCTEYDCEEMLLSEQEWRQIDYLLCITEPFFDYTTQLSKTRDVTAHYVFKIYNKLFDHLERSQAQLRRKRVPWKKQMLEALEAGLSLMRNIYAISTMLAPVNKFKFSPVIGIRNGEIPIDLLLNKPLFHIKHNSRLEEMLDGRDIQPRAITDEISQYLDSGRLLSGKSTRLAFRPLLPLREIHSHFQQLAQELNASLIPLEIFVTIVVEATLLEKFFSQDELEAAKEEREEKLSEIEVDPISDTEEQEDELEDKPGDAIEVVIEDRPEDIPEETPLPTSEYGRPCSPSLPNLYTDTSIREKT